MTDNPRRQLERVFREQQRFAADYSPLYARLFAAVAGWLADEADPLAGWLVAASAGRPPFDVTLLLAATLHHEVLAGTAPALARFYATAGAAPAARPPATDGRPEQEERAIMADGGRSVQEEREISAVGGRPSAVEFEATLRATILDRRAALEAFIQRRSVQTNETARGLAWLLPVACLGWPAVHLVELGASAGLNLVAERRAYRLVDGGDPARTLLAIGAGDEAPFITEVRGGGELPAVACCPAVLSRTGGDSHPFYLRSAADERVLASFVWGDQPERLARLRQGIAELHRVEATTAPVRLRPLRLPDELAAFLRSEQAGPLYAPVVLFNTTVTMYLPDRGASLRGIIGEWAAGQHAPVLWLQWEVPPAGGPEPPEEAWLAWTADYWPNGGEEPRHWHLAWVHPHGRELEFSPDWDEFVKITMQI
jgi:hypothetical protein